MREVFREYGGTVIAVLIGVLLFLLIFGNLSWKGNKGIIAVLGQGAKIEEKDFSEYADSKKIIQIMEKKRPVITYKNIPVYTKNVFEEDALFTAEDAEGNLLETEVFKIEDSVGSEVVKADGKICFEKQGIYRCWVKAVDADCGVTEQVFSIPVRCR
ncbi:MAG: hypothetical protein J6A92_06645 [Lachnospiraceae bacterium]|nr:hypothetical protein [Lachnospiraceae bacterium]